MNVTCLVAALQLDMDVRVANLEATRILYRDWQGETPDKFVQADSENIENMVAIITIDDVMLKFRVEGRIARCCKYVPKGHIRGDCSPPLLKSEVRD